MKSICLLFLLIPAFTFAASQKYLANVEKKLDSLFSTEIPDTAVLKAVRIVTEDDSLSSEETEHFYAKKIFPFIEKKKANVSHLMLAVAYRSRALTVSKFGEIEEHRKYMEMAYNHILKVGDTGYQELRQKGAVCYSYASMQLFFGDIAKAHKVFYQAIRAAEKIKDYNKVMESFYALAIYYTQVKDTKRLDNILADIREIFRKADGDVPPRAYYSWYSVATARYALDTDRPEMRDSALLYSRKSLDIVEKYGPELERGTANFAWNYYNHALFFIEKPYVNEDSASYYLEITHEKATKANAIQAVASHYQIPLENTVAFGDYYNDEDMLEMAGVSYVVDNAPNDLKEKADHVTLSNNDDGVAFILNQFYDKESL